MALDTNAIFVCHLDLVDAVIGFDLSDRVPLGRQFLDHFGMREPLSGWYVQPIGVS